MARVDKNSITVIPTLTKDEFTIGFDFTEDDTTPLNEGWKCVWYKAGFLWNINWPVEKLLELAADAQVRAKIPVPFIALQNKLRESYGDVFVRIDPDTIPLLVKLVT